MFLLIARDLINKKAIDSLLRISLINYCMLSIRKLYIIVISTEMSGKYVLLGFANCGDDLLNTLCAGVNMATSFT